ncbi:HAD-IIA family hydrolase [Marihabitans asiaticum]|uniref:HAD superfamily hydrolase (TIGR01450 family) n=1 Tax=Marihabitans asiaticum TaxID=415218 RepID=A0A560WAZ5_9MICO|nr:HAD-IIA family hydrolase [Marihabitans asiaticum]TWD14655.1 HAD superfamily hydrolase (TIGR01450 family) [Marihabitans asiaticum]
MTPSPSATTASPLRGVEGLICDLDGVVYRGADAVPHAVEALSGTGLPVVYATNNASRPPEAVAEQLRSLGLHVDPADVVTSSTTAAAILGERLPRGARVLAIGGPGVAQALTEGGYEVVLPSDAAGSEPVDAVVQGYGPQVCAADLAEAAYAIEGGALWLATNDDQTLPTERGIAPGNGSLVGAVAGAVQRRPEVVGKPNAPMYQIAARRLGCPPARVLAIGDRLETDIAGATAAGTKGALVLTGVHGWVDAAQADPTERPDLVLEDLRGLRGEYPPAQLSEGTHRRGGAMARFDGSEVRLEGRGVDALRAALDAVWAAVDDARLTRADAQGVMQRLVERAG